MKNEMRIITRTLRVIGKALLDLVKAIIKMLYLLEVAKNNLVAKLFNKLPRLAKVTTIYTLLVLSVMQVVSLTNPKVIEKIVTQVETIEVVNAKEVETTETENVEVVETSNCTYSNENACNIYNKSLELGLTENQAIIAIAISAHETGNWKSNLFVNNYNFGGLYYNGSFISYDNYNEGLESLIKNLKGGYFEKGLTTIEQIGAKWAPVGAKNDPNGLNNNWVSSVTSIYNNYVK